MRKGQQPNTSDNLRVDLQWARKVCGRATKGQFSGEVILHNRGGGFKPKYDKENCTGEPGKHRTMLLLGRWCMRHVGGMYL